MTREIYRNDLKTTIDVLRQCLSNQFTIEQFKRRIPQDDFHGICNYINNNIRSRMPLTIIRSVLTPIYYVLYHKLPPRELLEFTHSISVACRLLMLRYSHVVFANEVVGSQYEIYNEFCFFWSYWHQKDLPKILMISPNAVTID